MPKKRAMHLLVKMDRSEATEDKLEKKAYPADVIDATVEVIIISLVMMNGMQKYDPLSAGENRLQIKMDLLRKNFLEIIDNAMEEECQVPLRN